MTRFSPTATVLAALTLGVAVPAFAADQSLEFKLVTKALEAKVVEVPNVDGQLVMMNKMYGAAFFKDGRIAAKEFLYSADFNRGTGPFYGYSTYQFEDGSTITARFAGTNRAGQPMHGEYTITSGTGKYAGAKGTGYFDAIPHKLTGSNIYNGMLMVSLP